MSRLVARLLYVRFALRTLFTQPRGREVRAMDFSEIPLPLLEILRSLKRLEYFPAEVGVETVVEDVCVAGEGLVVGERELHPSHDGI
jgi:hypothetical protein